MPRPIDMPSGLQAANQHLLSILETNRNIVILPERISAVESICETLLSESHIRQSIGNIRYLIKSFMLPIDGYLHVGADILSKFTMNFPPPFSTLSAKSIRSFINGKTYKLHKKSYKTLLYLPDRMAFYGHPAAIGGIREIALRGLPELVHFHEALFGPTRQVSGDISLRGQGLYSFLGYENSVEKSKKILGSNLLGKIDTETCPIGEVVAKVTAIRLSSDSDSYITSVAMIGLQNSKSRRDTQYVFMKTITKQGVDGDNKKIKNIKEIIRSSGFALLNSANDAYFLQHQKTNGSFNITFIPSYEFNHGDNEFAKGIIITFDEVNLSSGLISRIAIFPSSYELQLPGLCSEADLRLGFNQCLGDKGEDMADETIDYLRRNKDISLKSPLGEGGLLNNWGDIVEYLREVDGKKAIEKKGIVGYMRRPVRAL